MNERIKELATQSKPLDENGQKVRGLNSEFHDQWMEKFAELIVRECIGVVKSDGEDSPLAADLFRIKADEIKEHFGVIE